MTIEQAARQLFDSIRSTELVEKQYEFDFQMGLDRSLYCRFIFQCDYIEAVGETYFRPAEYAQYNECLSEMILYVKNDASGKCDELMTFNLHYEFEKIFEWAIEYYKNPF